MTKGSLASWSGTQALSWDPGTTVLASDLDRVPWAPYCQLCSQYNPACPSAAAEMSCLWRASPHCPCPHTDPPFLGLVASWCCPTLHLVPQAFAHDPNQPFQGQSRTPGRLPIYSCFFISTVLPKASAMVSYSFFLITCLSLQLCVYFSNGEDNE